MGSCGSLEDSASESSVSDFDRSRSMLSRPFSLLCGDVVLFSWSDDVSFSGDKDCFCRFANIPSGFFLVLERVCFLLESGVKSGALSSPSLVPVRHS